MSQNIEDLSEQLNEWQEKLNFFKKEEANIVDLPQKYQANKHIKEAEEKIKAIEEKIIICKTETKNINTPKIDEKLEIKTLHQALDLFIDQKNKLNSRTTKEEIEEIEKIKTEILAEVFGDYTKKITEIPILRDKTVTNLFERVFAEEKLTKSTIDDINNIRADKKNYSYYYRSIIVSSLTLSLLNFKTFDGKKLDLLIDFLTDFEDGVWRRALTGIVIAVLIHQNRLERFPELIKRLKSLQNLENIQAGIYIIDKILRNKLFEHVAFLDEIENNEFLTSSPYNWFFPFYRNNKVLTDALENTEHDIDSAEFSIFIHKIPLLSCFKYMLCMSLEKNKLSFERTEKPNSSEAKTEELNGLDLAYTLQPYYNLIAELFLYYKFFPQQRVKDLFNSKTTIAQTKLKNIILSKVQALKLLADLHYEKDEFKSCIVKLRELLNLDSNQLSALIQISECLIETSQFSEALTYLFQVEKIQPENVTNLYDIGYCLNRDDQFKKSNEYLIKADTLQPDTKAILNILANNYFNLKEYKESILLNERILLQDANHIAAIDELNRCYAKLNNHEKALEYSLKLFELDNENPEYLIGLASDYSELDDTEKSEPLAEKAYDMKRDDNNVVFTYGRILFLNGNFEKSEAILNRLFNLKDSKEYYGIIYGNLGHMALFEGEEENAMAYYKKCVLEFEDIKDFEEKFDTDLKYALKRNISEEKYMGIKNELINYWSLNKS